MILSFYEESKQRCRLFLLPVLTDSVSKYPKNSVRINTRLVKQCGVSLDLKIHVVLIPLSFHLMFSLHTVNWL